MENNPFMGGKKLYKHHAHSMTKSERVRRAAVY